MTRTPALLLVTAAALLSGGLFYTSARADDGDLVVAEADDDADEARQEAEEARREAAEAQREAVRAQREAQRDAARAQRDAAREAAQAAREAARAQQHVAGNDKEIQRMARDQARAAVQVARDQIRVARDTVARDAHIPAALKQSILTRLDKTQRIMTDRINKAAGGDWSDFEAQMEQMGEEIEQTFDGLDTEMEAFGKSMDEWGKKFGDDLTRKFNGRAIPAVPPIPPVPSVPGVAPVPPLPPMPPMNLPFQGRRDGDMSDLDLHVDLDALSLTPAQRQALDRIVSDESRTVDTAKASLDRLSQSLRTTLSNPDADETAIARTVDAISAEEAKIRKARILAWAKTRKVLNDQQRSKLERGRRNR